MARKRIDGEIFAPAEVRRVLAGASAIVRPLRMPSWVSPVEIVGFVPAETEGWLAVRTGDDVASLAAERVPTGLTYRLRVGYVVYVKEAYRDTADGVCYRADSAGGPAYHKCRKVWRGALRMPARASRLWLEVVATRPAFVWSVTEADIALVGLSTRIEFERYCAHALGQHERPSQAIWLVEFEQVPSMLDYLEQGGPL